MQQPSDATVFFGMALFLACLLAAALLLLLGPHVLLSGLGLTRLQALHLGWTCTIGGVASGGAAVGLGVWLGKCRYGPTCCRNCGYDLRGCRGSERCPECGERRYLRRVEPD